MKYWQVEHKGWFHPNVLNQTSTDKLNKQEDSIQKFGIGQEEQTSWTYRVTCIFNLCSSCLVQNLDGITVSVQLVWFKTFEWNLPVCLICQYWSTDKLNIQGGSIQVLNQTWSTDKLNIQEDSFWKFSTREVEHTGLKLLDGITLYVQIVCSSCLVQNFWIESPCMFNLFVLHVWFKTFRWNLPLCSICKYFLYQTLSTDKLNIQDDSIQKFWTRHEILTN
jgi:hypothetical protein